MRNQNQLFLGGLLVVIGAVFLFGTLFNIKRYIVNRSKITKTFCEVFNFNTVVIQNIIPFMSIFIKLVCSIG